MSYVNDQRLLTQKRIEEILKDYLPSDRDKTVSKIMYEMGLTKEKAREYIKVLFDLDKIKYNKERKLVWQDN